MSGGRGRGMTLPAWMTNGTASAAASTTTSSTTASSISSTSASSADASVATAAAPGQFDPAPAKPAAVHTYTPAVNAATTMSAPPVPTAALPAAAAPTWFNPQAPPMQPPPRPFAGMPPPRPLPGQPPMMPHMYGQQMQMQMPPPFMHQPGGMMPHAGMPPNPAMMMGMGMGAGVPPMMPPPAGGAGYPPRGPGGMPMPPFMPPGMIPAATTASAGTGSGASTASPRGPAPLYQQFQQPVPAGIQDSNNDASAWSEHEAPSDRRKFWFNRITKVSTFDKPACLKTPEERSIPPCSWKEYSTEDGKKYYSNGKDTTWTMPEEFRVWQERVEAASKKRPAAATGAGGIPPSSSSGSLAALGAGTTTTSGKKAGEESRELVAPVFATKEEALAAFRGLLHDKRISSTQKFKEVQELCGQDARWLALPNVGERKQALAEYQTKKIKDEKEEQKLKLKKARDSFLQMLAENTEIDANTRWRTAQTLLMNDQRYKMLESERDKEDLFEEFVKELSRKEREDSEKARRAATDLFNTFLSELVAEKKVNRKTSWADARPLLVVSGSAHSALSDGEMRRYYNDFIDGLDRAYREEQKKQRDQEREAIESRERAFKNYILSLTKSVEGEIRPLVHGKSRFSEVSDSFKGSSFYIELEEAYNKEISDDSAPRRKKTIEDFFDNMLVDVERAYKQDYKVIKEELREVKFKFSPLSTYEDIIFALHHAADSPRSSSSLKDILEKRPYNIRQYFCETKAAKLAEEEEEKREAAKREARFIELLEDYYYRSDHVGITWEEAKDDLYKRSAYADLDRETRKRLFDKYMADLAAKLPKKRSKPEKVESEIEAGEIVDEVTEQAVEVSGEATAAAVTTEATSTSMDESRRTDVVSAAHAVAESGRGRSLSRGSRSPSAHSSRSSSSRKESKKRRLDESGKKADNSRDKDSKKERRHKSSKKDKKKSSKKSKRDSGSSSKSKRHRSASASSHSSASSSSSSSASRSRSRSPGGKRR